MVVCYAPSGLSSALHAVFVFFVAHSEEHRHVVCCYIDPW